MIRGDPCFQLLRNFCLCMQRVHASLQRYLVYEWVALSCTTL